MIVALRSIAIFLTALLLWGCEATNPTDPRTNADQSVGPILKVTGPGVLVNGGPGTDGQMIAYGDSIATGPGVSAMLDFGEGTVIQLDENSDPVRLTWREERIQLEIDDAAIRATKGDRFNVFDLIGRLADFFSWSEFIVVEDFPRSYRVDLIQGRMKIVRPAGGPDGFRELTPGQFFEILEGESRVGKTSRSERRNLNERFDRWGLRGSRRNASAIQGPVLEPGDIGDGPGVVDPTRPPVTSPPGSTTSVVILPASP